MVKTNIQFSQSNQFQLDKAGFSIPELLIVLLIIAIIVVFALPDILSAKRLFNFSAMKHQVSVSLRETRQSAMSHRKPITVRYEDVNKRLVIFGGSLGVFGAPENTIVELNRGGLPSDEIRYGLPPGVSSSTLGDGTVLTTLSSGIAEITFQGDGTVVDGSDNPVDNALFFYHSVYEKDAAFAVSVLGTSGRVKQWYFSVPDNAYVE